MSSNWFILLVCLQAITLNAQVVKKHSTVKNTKVRDLIPGDIVPNILIQKIINDNKINGAINDYKDQLLILDFWATTCSGCVRALPHHVVLQKEFGAKIKILPVTYEDEDLAKSFLKKNKLTKNLNIPSVVEDKVLSRWFKHQTIPHEVWIYKGKVIAITDIDYVDQKNIQDVLDEKKTDWPVKDDFAYYDYKTPIFKTKVIPKTNGVKSERSPCYSGITGYQEGALPKLGLVTDSLSYSQRFCIINYSILNAYLYAWQPLSKVTNPFPNQIRLEVKDRSKYIKPRDAYYAAWTRKNDISYEMQWHNMLTETERAKIIISDLDRMLGLHGRWEKRTEKCLVLVRVSQNDSLKAKGNDNVFDVDSAVKRLRNNSLGNLVYHMNQFSENPRVFDETDYPQPVDLDLDFGFWTDISAIRKALQRYGLDLKEETREMDFFILTENK